MFKNRTIIKLLLIVMIVLSTISFFGCESNDVPDNKKSGKDIIYNVEESIDISYYEYCTIPSVVAKDSDGNLYFPNITVKDCNDKTISLENNQFFVTSIDNYKFIYEWTIDGKTVTKTTIAYVKDRTAPEVVLTETSIAGFIGDTITIPGFASILDNKDSLDDLTKNIVVTLGTKEITVTNNQFTASEAGDYVITYSVKDKSNNETIKTVTCYVIEKDQNSIVYFNKSFGGIIGNITTNFNSTFTYDETIKLPGSTEGSFALTSSDDSTLPAAIGLNKPLIKDVSGFNYLYIDVYNPNNEVLYFYVNYIYDIPLCKLTPKAWTRVVIAKENNVFNMTKTVKKIGDTGDGSTDIFYTGNPNYTICESNIEGMSIGFISDYSSKTAYIASFKAVNELPELPEGVSYAKAENILSTLPNAAFINDKIVVDYTATDLENAEIDIKLSVNGADTITITKGSEYTFNSLGKYEFIFTATKNDVVVYQETKTLFAIEKDESVVAYLSNEYGILINDLVAWNSSISYDATNGGLKLTGEGTPVAFRLNNPSIETITKKYVYMDVYNPNTRDLDLVVNYAYGYPKLKLSAGKTTRVVLKHLGNTLYLFGSYENQQGEAGYDIGVISLKERAIAIETLNSDEYVIFKNIYTVDELPELPTGVQYTDHDDNTVAFLGTKGSLLLADEWTKNFSTSLYYPGTFLDVSSNDGAHTSIKLSNVLKKDISGYKYMYIDICNGYKDQTFKVCFDYAWGTPYVTIEANTTVRIVLEIKDNNLYLLGKTGSLNSTDDEGSYVLGRYSSDNQTLTDITNFEIHAVFDDAYKSFAIKSDLMVCNELPELPAGVAYNHDTLVALGLDD